MESSDGTNTVSNTYDADGLRTSKTVNGVEHTYYYAGGKLLRESFGGNTLDFFYDSNGNAYALKYNGILYYYITNLQGDVMSIVDAQGAVVASYNYDPYGNLISDEPAENTVGHLNPLRYRGYYYDSESGFYYLQSRYYDPEVGRFLNADAYASTGQGILGNNMFAYCLNNPSSMFDATGNLPFFIVTAVAGALIGGIIGYATTGSWNGALAGAAIGGLVGLAGGAATASLLTGSVTASTSEVIAGGVALLTTTATAILTQAEKIAQQVGKTYRALTKSNFRYNLQKLTGNLGNGMQAHHVLPQKFIEAFSKAGINIHNPLFGSWVDSTHQSWSSEYNQAWEAFFQVVQNPTAKQIFEKAAELAKQYGFEIYFK